MEGKRAYFFLEVWCIRIESPELDFDKVEGVPVISNDLAIFFQSESLHSNCKDNYMDGQMFNFFPSRLFPAMQNHLGLFRIVSVHDCTIQVHLTRWVICVFSPVIQVQNASYCQIQHTLALEQGSRLDSHANDTLNDGSRRLCVKKHLLNGGSIIELLLLSVFLLNFLFVNLKGSLEVSGTLGEKEGHCSERSLYFDALEGRSKSCRYAMWNKAFFEWILLIFT